MLYYSSSFSFYIKMPPKHKQAKRRLKQLGATLDPSRAGWSDSEEEDLIHEGNIA